MSGGSSDGRVTLQSSYLALIAGLRAYYAPTERFTLLSGDLTRDELIAELEKYVEAAEATKASNQVWRSNVQAERQVEASVSPVRADLRSALEARFGKSGAQLLQFGFQPRKVAQRSSASKAGAVVKLRATREARGTKGSKQRQGITGGVTGVMITAVKAGPPVPVDPAALATPQPLAPTTPEPPAQTGAAATAAAVKPAPAAG